MKLNKDILFRNSDEQFKEMLELCKPSLNEMIIYYFLYPQQFFREINFNKAFGHFIKK